MRKAALFIFTLTLSACAAAKPPAPVMQEPTFPFAWKTGGNGDVTFKVGATTMTLNPNGAWRAVHEHGACDMPAGGEITAYAPIGGGKYQGYRLPKEGEEQK